MMVILLDGGNWNEINVLTSNFILLGDQLLDEILYRHAIYFYIGKKEFMCTRERIL